MTAVTVRPSSTLAATSQHSHRRTKSHRRSLRACDECRLRKRKCNGTCPCEPCKASDLGQFPHKSPQTQRCDLFCSIPLTVGCVECDYGFRRPPIPPTQRIRELEQRLRHAAFQLQSAQTQLAPGSGIALKPVLDILTSWSSEKSSATGVADEDDGDRHVVLSSMLAGSDYLITSGPFTTHRYGALSEIRFVLCTVELFDTGAYDVRRILTSTVEVFDLPPPLHVTDGPGWDRHPPSLPDKNVCVCLLASIFDRSSTFLSFLQQQHLLQMIDLVYDDSGEHSIACQHFRPLLHHLLALGYLFSRSEHQTGSCQTSLEASNRHFRAGQLLLSTHQSDLISIQSLLCAAVYLMSTSRIARAHAPIALAASSSLRMGLHCNTATRTDLSPAEKALRVMVFLSVVKLDLYISLILDLPPTLRDGMVSTSVENVRIASSPRGDDTLHPEVEASTMHVELLHFVLTSRKALLTDAGSGDVLEEINPSHLVDVEIGLSEWSRRTSDQCLRLREYRPGSL